MKKLLPFIGALIGLVIAFLLRPGFSSSFGGKAAIEQPSVAMMFQCAISCNYPDITSASRYGLIYIILGIIVGALGGWLIGRLIQKKNTN